MTRPEFRLTARKIVTLAQVAASFTPTNKDDQVVELLEGLVNDDVKFNQLCDVLGLPAL